MVNNQKITSFFLQKDHLKDEILDEKRLSLPDHLRPLRTLMAEVRNCLDLKRWDLDFFCKIKVLSRLALDTMSYCYLLPYLLNSQQERASTKLRLYQTVCPVYDQVKGTCHCPNHNKSKQYDSIPCQKIVLYSTSSGTKKTA